MARRQARWFYRERKDEGVWLLFDAGESDQIELAWRRRRASVLLPARAARKVHVAERTVEDVESGATTAIVRGTWFFARSDRLLQPYPEPVAERLADSVRRVFAAAARVPREAWSFNAGDDRVIYVAAGGGFVQVAPSGKVRLVTQLFPDSGSSASRVYGPFVFCIWPGGKSCGWWDCSRQRTPGRLEQPAGALRDCWGSPPTPGASRAESARAQDRSRQTAPACGGRPLARSVRGRRGSSALVRGNPPARETSPHTRGCGSSAHACLHIKCTDVRLRVNTPAILKAPELQKHCASDNAIQHRPAGAPGPPDGGAGQEDGGGVQGGEARDGEGVAARDSPGNGTHAEADGLAALREPLVVPEGTGPQWFYSRDDRSWVPYSASSNASLENAYGKYLRLQASGGEGTPS